MVDDLILYIARKIVDKPEEVVLSRETRDRETVWKLAVDDEDLGKIIGRKGRVIRALRVVANACAHVEGKMIHLEVEGKSPQ